MKKIIIINPTNDSRKVYKQPFGLITLASQFMDSDCDVVWMDADINRGEDLGRSYIETEISKHHDASLICIGGLNTTYRFVRDFFAYIGEKQIQIPVLLGGRIAQDIDYILWNKIGNLKYICKYEGERVVDWLCNNDLDLDRAPGVARKVNGHILSNPPVTEISDLDEAPKLRWELLDKKYFETGWGFILTSRGCPFKCSFCQTKGKKYRTLSHTRIVDEIKTLINLFGVKKIGIADELFLVQKKRVSDLCGHIQPLGIKWRCSSRGDLITVDDFELLRKMKRSGCERIVMGIESGSNKVLYEMKKGETIEQVENAIRLINLAGMEVSPTFIFGHPGETHETALETVAWRKKMGFYGGYFYATPFPNTPLYETYIRRYNLSLDEEVEYLEQSPYMKSLKINLTEMSLDELMKLDDTCRSALKDQFPRLRRVVINIRKIIFPLIAPITIKNIKLRRGTMKRNYINK